MIGFCKNNITFFGEVIVFFIEFIGKRHAAKLS